MCRNLKFVTNLEGGMQHKYYNTKFTFLTLLIFDTQLTKINAKDKKMTMKIKVDITFTCQF